MTSNIPDLLSLPLLSASRCRRIAGTGSLAIRCWVFWTLLTSAAQKPDYTWSRRHQHSYRSRRPRWPASQRWCHKGPGLASWPCLWKGVRCKTIAVSIFMSVQFGCQSRVYVSFHRTFALFWPLPLLIIVCPAFQSIFLFLSILSSFFLKVCLYPSITNFMFFSSAYQTECPLCCSGHACPSSRLSVLDYYMWFLQGLVPAKQR